MAKIGVNKWIWIQEDRFCVLHCQAVHGTFKTRCGAKDRLSLEEAVQVSGIVLGQSCQMCHLQMPSEVDLSEAGA